MGIGEKAGAVQLKLPAFFHICLVDLHRQHFCKEHMMGSQLLYFGHSALNVHRAFTGTV